MLADQRRVPTGAAGRNHDPVHRPQFRQRHVQTAEFGRGLLGVEPAPHRILDRARLLEDFLQHVVREHAALGGFRAEFDPADLDGRCVGAEVLHLELFRRQRNHVVIVQVNHLARVRNDGGGVTGQEMFAFADPHQQRRSPPRAHDGVRTVRANDSDTIGADDFLERFHHGPGQSRRAVRVLRPAGRFHFCVMLADQMGEDLGVGLRTKLVSRQNQALFDPLEVLDDAVVDHCDPAARVEVRVGVFVRRRAVCGPAGVADTHLAGSGPGIQDLAKTFIDLSFFLARLQFRAVQHAQAGAVVAAVFEPAQPLQEDGRRLLLADVAYNAAHKSSSCR